jgi:hypothetical protein
VVIVFSSIGLVARCDFLTGLYFFALTSTKGTPSGAAVRNQPQGCLAVSSFSDHGNRSLAARKAIAK